MSFETKPPLNKPQPDRATGSWLALALAALLGIAAVAGLVSVLAMTMGVILAPLLIVAGLFGLIVLQYLVWGWLGASIIRNSQANDPGEEHEIQNPRTERNSNVQDSEP